MLSESAVMVFYGQISLSSSRACPGRGCCGLPDPQAQGFAWAPGRYRDSRARSRWRISLIRWSSRPASPSRQAHSGPSEGPAMVTSRPCRREDRTFPPAATASCSRPFPATQSMKHVEGFRAQAHILR